jgi:hypothetical protein
MNLINSMASFVFSRRMTAIDHFRNSPHEVQEKTFRQLVASAKDTCWGRQYEYATIKNAEQFRFQVPVSTYEDLYPYIERMLQGEQNVLWHTPIHWFSKSSGTTNARSKFIPVSKEALQCCNFQGGKDMIALYLDNHPQTKVFRGKSLSIGGSLQQNHLNSQTQYGDVSAVIMKNLPFWAEYLRTPSLKTALMDKWEEKLVAMAAETMQVNVTSMAGVPTWTVVLIEKIVELSGKKNICEVWQNLEVFFHGAVSFTPYRQLFKTLIPKEGMNYMEVYNASEGFFALQDQANSEEMLLMLDYGVYYEFIPMEFADQPNAKAIGLEQVEIGKNYALLISTNAGLWRYKIGDTIRFTSKNPYRIRISGRTKHFINAFGEEVVVENAEIALAKACEQTSAVISNFTAAPVYLQSTTKGYQKGGHEWVIEFEKQPADIQQFTAVLDQTLRQINSDYDAKRHQGIALVMPKIHAAPQGTFYEWLKRKNKLGGQNKVPRLANNREYIDEILEIIR